MSKLETFGIPGIANGVLHPAMKNRFRVQLNGNELICQQVTKTCIDMLNRDITIWIEQPAGMAQEMLDAISALCTRSSFPEPLKFPFSVDLLDGTGQAYSNVSGFAHVVKHVYELDYSASDVATHVLTVRYTRSAQ